jgi:hypothetical protein
VKYATPSEIYTGANVSKEYTFLKEIGWVTIDPSDGDYRDWVADAPYSVSILGWNAPTMRWSDLTKPQKVALKKNRNRWIWNKNQGLEIIIAGALITGRVLTDGTIAIDAGSVAAAIDRDRQGSMSIEDVVVYWVAAATKGSGKAGKMLNALAIAPLAKRVNAILEQVR